MRILHFSDFHLRPGRAGERSLNILERMLEAVDSIKMQKPIDLVVFTGDLVDKAGQGFNISYEDALNLFKEKVIDRVVNATGIPPYGFLFVGGNHEIKRDTLEETIREHDIQVMLSSENALDRYMTSDDIEKNTSTSRVFREFHHRYYKAVSSENVVVNVDHFQTTLIFDVDGTKVGIALLDSAWMCFDNHDEKHIAMGVLQLNRAWPDFRDCDVTIALAHHHPTFLKDFDKDSINSSLRGHFDLYFCGHTHGQKCQYVDDPDGSIFESIASGNLYDNLHQIDEDYKNGFSVIDYDVQSKSVEVTPYYQQKDESFNLDLNFGKEGNGTAYFYRHEYGTLKRLDEWLIKMPTLPIIGENVLVPKRQELVDRKYNRILLTALPGLGKTRLVHDAFFDGAVHRNSFYAELSATNQESVKREVKENVNRIGTAEGLIVIDNCTKGFCQRMAAIVPNQIRLICVDNEYYDSQTYIDGFHLVSISPDELRPFVDDYIRNELPLTKDNIPVYEQIKLIADGFPFMACELVLQFHKNQQVRLNVADYLVPKLLRYEKGKEQNQEAIMIALALFQPFPLQKANKAAFDFIINHELLFGIDGSYILKQKAMNSLINRFSPTLVEKSDKWVNVRPFPLAVWLVGKWFSSLDDNMVEQLLNDFEELKQKDSSAYQLLVKCMVKRIEYMRRNELAYEIITRLNENEGSPFANEKVVCSDMGSRLFLAMSSVNPVAVCTCLTRILAKKDTEWLSNYIKDDVRRNLVMALEKICFDKRCYSDGAILLAQLALAENEHWGNNATGQFLQLFHICLAGTEADLQYRLGTLRQLKVMGGLYIPMVIKAINSAFTQSSFMRTGGAERFGDDKLQDYQPTNSEICDYWYACRDILLDIIATYPEKIDMVSDVIETHAVEWLRNGFFDSIFKPIVDKAIVAKLHNWPMLYRHISRFVRDRDLIHYSDENKKDIKAYVESLRPSTFLSLLLDAQVAYSDRPSFSVDDVWEKLDNLYAPLAEKFVHDQFYTNEREIELIACDKEFIDFVFSKHLVRIMSDNQLSVLLGHFLDIIKRKGEGFHSPFIIKVCLEANGREPLESFMNDMLRAGFKHDFTTILGRCENNELTRFRKLHNLIMEGTLDDVCIVDYLNSVSCDDIDHLQHLLTEVLSLYPNSIKDAVATFLRFRFLMRDDDSDSFFEFAKSLLLQYPIDNEQPRTNFEYGRLVADLLEKRHDVSFAQAMNRKVIDGLNQNFYHGNFDFIYPALFNYYLDDIWDDFVKAFLSDDYAIFWIQVQYTIGSGFNFGVGPMFKDNDERIKKMCMDYPDKAPAKIASMVPVFLKPIDKVDSYSPLFLWLLENYGDCEEVRSGLHANLYSFSWSGSVLPLFEAHKRCLQHIPPSPKEVINQWVTNCINELNERIKQEKEHNDFMRMHYGYTID